MIKVNGRDYHEDSLRVKLERRRRRLLLTPEEEERLFKLQLLTPAERAAGSYAGIRYQVVRALELHGSKLEPPLEPEGAVSLVWRLARPLLLLSGKLRRKLVRMGASSYLQQQERFNAMLAQSLDTASLLLKEGGKKRRPGEEERLPLSRDGGELGEEMVQALVEHSREKIGFLGLPGINACERVLEKGKFSFAVSLDREEVYRYQSHFLPVRWADPVTFLRASSLKGCSTLVISSPWRFTAGALCMILRAVKEKDELGLELLCCLPSRATVPTGGKVRITAPTGEVIWTEEFLAWLLESEGYVLERVSWGEGAVLVGRRA
jgi:hypothetical protein